MKDMAAEYAYLVTLVCVIAVIVGSAAYTRQVRKTQQEALAPAAAGAPETEATETPPMMIKTTPLPTIAPLEVRVSVFEEKASWPVEGRVLRHHDQQELIFWKALNIWQTHAGIDIAGETEQDVRCAGSGTVKRITRDALWGCSVEVEQGDGRIAVYRGLELCYVDEGETIARGQKVGTLLKSIPCEEELSTHLHMEIIRGGAQQDPLAMLPER